MLKTMVVPTMSKVSRWLMCLRSERAPAIANGAMIIEARIILQAAMAGAGASLILMSMEEKPKQTTPKKSTK
jgi:cation diffusion facilitator CzcD-associated flavoprotein CzcO